MKIFPGRVRGRIRTSSSFPLVFCILALTIGLGYLVSTSDPASAQENQDIAAIDLEPLRSIVGASTVPYEVTVVSDRAIEGTLQIRVQDQNLSFEFPLALAANTEISQLVAIPVQNDFMGQIIVNLIVDGTTVASVQEFGADGNFGTDFVAGVLGLEVNAEQSQVTPPVGMVTNVEIDDLRILSALDIVVSSPAALRTLTAEEQAQLFTWVGSGGQLAIADEAGSIDELLPPEWQGAGSTVSAGVGEINHIGTDWDEALPPPVSTSNGTGFFGDFGASDAALASDAGFQVPSIGLLSLVLLGYLFIIGPVTFMVLAKMDRQALAWLAIPVLAVLFGVVIVGAGRVLISGRNDAYASIVTVTPAGSEVSSTLLIAADGSPTIDLPAGWSARGNGAGSQFGFGGGGGGSQLAIFPSRTTTELAFEVDTGSAAVVRVEGRTADAELPFAFADVEIRNGNLIGSMTNQSGVELGEVAILVGSNAMYVDALADGETLDFDIEMQPANRRTFPEMVEWDVQVDFRFGFEEPELDEDGFVNGASWMRWRLDNFGAAVPDGMITAVGWSRELDQYSLIGGEGRTALVQHAALPTSSDATSGQIRRTIPRAATWQDIEGFGRDFGEGIPTEYIRPEGSSTEGLAIETSAELEELAMWVDGEWRYIDLENNIDARTVTIPEDAWTNDRITAVFGFGGFGFNGDANAFQPRVVEADGESAEGVLRPSGERSTRTVQFEDNFEGGGFGQEFGPEFINEEQVIVRESRESLNFASDGLLDNSYDTWSVLLEPGDEITVTMRSNDLDSLLIVNDQDGFLVAENDDANNGAMGLDSQLSFVADEWGFYVIETRPLFGPAFGNYSLSVEVDPPQDEAFTWFGEGELGDDAVSEWPVRMTAEETAIVTLTSEFAPDVTWIGADGAELPLEVNPDGSTTFAPGVDGTYTIVLSGEAAEDVGTEYLFELVVEGS